MQSSDVESIRRLIEEADQMDGPEQAKRYANACRAWFGDQAREAVFGKLEERRRVGDQVGTQAWERVANELARQQGRQTVRLS